MDNQNLSSLKTDQMPEQLVQAQLASTDANVVIVPQQLGRQQNQPKPIVYQDQTRELHKSKLSKYLLVGLIVVVAMGGSLLTYIATQHSKNNPEATSHTVKSVSTVVLSNNTLNGYTLFQKSIGPKSYAVQLSLVDPSGKLVQSATSSYPLNLYTVLDNGLFLLKEDDFDVTANSLSSPSSSYGGSFWIASKSGIQKANTQVNQYLTQGAGTQTAIKHVFAAGQQQVVYTSCEYLDGGNTNCSLFLLDILSGQQQQLPSTAIKDYIAAFSSMGDENDQISNDGKYLYILDPNASNYSLITFDYRADKIITSKPIPGLKSSYGRFWIAPNGQTIAYVPDSGNKITVVMVATGKQSQSTLPSNWVTESWSGESAETGPLWSPDGTRLAYTSYTQNNVGNETISLLDIKSLKNTVIANHVGQQFGSGQISNQYSNFRWMSDSQLDFNEITISGTAPSKAPQYGRSYLYSVSSGNLQTIPQTNGGSVGRYNGSY